MKHVALVCMIFFSMKLIGQDLSDIELFSPRSSIALKLKRGHFELSKQRVHYDMIDRKVYAEGSYIFKNDTLLLLTTNSKVFTLIKETYEIFDPVNVDSVQSGQKFLAWAIRYKNGRTMQSGGWTTNNEKEGVWQFSDSTGNSFYNKLYKNGKLLDDNFKFKRQQ